MKRNWHSLHASALAPLQTSDWLQGINNEYSPTTEETLFQNDEDLESQLQQILTYIENCINTSQFTQQDKEYLSKTIFNILSSLSTIEMQLKILDRLLQAARQSQKVQNFIQSTVQPIFER